MAHTVLTEFYLCFSRLPVPTLSIGDMLSQDGLTSLLVSHGGGEVATEDVVAEEKVLKGSSDGIARATDPHSLHHTYTNKKQKVIIQSTIAVKRWVK